MHSSDYILVIVTCPNLADAKLLAKTCVERRLAACAQVAGSPITSYYWWKSHIEEGQEHQVFLKSKASLWGQLENEIRELHPFEVPEILSIPIQNGFQPYLDWISSEVSEG